MLSPNPIERPANLRAVAETLDQVKRQASADDARRIWIPPVEQFSPPSEGSQLHIQLPHSAGPVWPPSVPSVSRRGRLSRRRVLIALGALTVATGVGIGMRWSTLGRFFPVFQKQSGNLIAWTPDSQGIASLFPGNTVQIWRATDGKTMVISHGDAGGDGPVSWSPDGKHFASILTGEQALAYRVQIWNTSDGRTTVISDGQFHNDMIIAASWSPESRRIASTTDAPTTVQVWDPTTGKTMLTCS